MVFTSVAAANSAAIALRAQGRVSDAIDAFRRALAEHPASVELRQNLAQTLYESGDTNGAITEHRTVLRADPHNVASHMALAELLQIVGERTLALAHQRLALEEQRLFSHVAPHEARSILALCAPGDWQTNIPLDFLVDRETTSVFKLYMLDAPRLANETLPRYDVVWNTIAHARESAQFADLAARLVRAQAQPSLNDARNVACLERDALPSLLAETGAIVAPVVESSATQLLHGQIPFAFPIIARPVGSHAGNGLAKLDEVQSCSNYVAAHEAPTYFVSPFLPYASADGFYRKYRIVFVDGTPFPVHLAISDAWMIHYYNALMAQHQWMRDEEAAFMADMHCVFDGPRYETLMAIASRVGLEYFGIDCAIDTQGRVIVFEADAAMLVHASDPVELYPYKREFIPRIFRAVEAMIDRRAQR